MKIGFAFFVVGIVFSIIFIAVTHGVREPSVRGSISYPANYGWYYVLDGNRINITLPCMIPANAIKDGSRVSIYRKVTPDFAGRSIGFYTKKQTVRVTLNGVQLYNWKQQGAPRWLKTYGWLFHIIEIPSNAKDMILCVTYDASIASAAGDCSEMFFGSRSEIINSMIALYMAQAIIACCLEMIGLFMLLVYILFKNMFVKDKTIFVLALLSIVAGLWQLEESKILYVIIQNPVVHWVFDYVLFLIIPVLLVPFAEEMTGRRNDIVFHVLFWSNILVVATCCILQFTGVAAFTETLLPIQLCDIITCVYTLFTVVMGIGRKDRNIKTYLPAVSILVIGVIVEICYYTFNGSANALFFGLTLLPFFIYLGINAYKESSRRFHDAEQVTMYHNLVFNDFPTNSLSRTAFYDFIDNCSFDKAYVLYMYDLNNFKNINDTYGHQAGDLVLKTFAACAKKAFENYGKVYRVGGDEFIVLCSETDEDTLNACEVTLNYLLSTHKELPVIVSASFGSARFIPKTKDDFFDAQKEADAKMYEMKRRYHGGRGDRRAARTE